MNQPNENETNDKQLAKAARISNEILALVNGGMDFKAAVDQVLGAGTFEGIASKVYEALRK